MKQQDHIQLPPIQTTPPIVHYYITTPPPVWQPPITKKSSNHSRRSSHSAIEKRRREKMNDKIERLKKLIPACTPQFPISVQQPIQKLSVLQAAIDYIQELHTQLQCTLPEDDPLLKDIMQNINKTP